jgi:hypothetical protein
MLERSGFVDVMIGPPADAFGGAGGASTSPGKWKLTARSASACTVRSTGSLNCTAPSAITVPSLPPKVSLRSEP